MAHIKLDQFLKLMQVVATGGAAKVLIQSQKVQVNDQVETRRGRKLVAGDNVTVQGLASYTVKPDMLS